MIDTVVQRDRGLWCRTASADTFQDVVGTLVRPAVVVADRRGAYDFQVDHLRLEHLEITLLRYGDPVEVDLQHLDDGAGDSLVLQLVLSGSSVSYLDRAAVELLRSRGQLVGGDTPMRVRCHRDCRHFLVRFDAQALQEVARMCDLPVEVPDPRSAVPLTSPDGKALLRYVRYITSEMEPEGALVSTRLVARATEQSLLTLMLAAVTATTAAEPAAPRTRAVPACVRRAEEYIDAHLEQDIGIGDIVASSGVSVRTLYRGFRLAQGLTPMSFLRNRRLERAHADLLAADPQHVRVIDVAFRWGFTHLSAFASQYRERFGWLPSQTLRGH